MTTTPSVQPPYSVELIKVLSPVTVQSGGTTSGYASLWTGEGPPSTVVGSQPGDEYLDIITGDLYRLEADFIS